jgi:predicted AAA+ superfamily ATPase
MGWLKAYAAATATSADYSKILDAATPGQRDKPARATVSVYQEHLERLFLLDPLEAWQPYFAPLKRLTGASQHHLVDPALAARLVGVGRSGLLVGQGDRVSEATGSWLGALFESLVVQSLRVYADTASTRVGHLRTKGGEREVDLVSEDAERGCVAIEVKLSDTVTDHDVRHLLWLKDKLGFRLKDAIVVNTGNFAYRRRDGIGVVPFSLLGP